MNPEDRVGEVLLGKLEIIRVLGGGGMGVVYEVEHRLTGHRRALKLVHAKYAGRPRFMKRLLREAKVAGKLQTPYVVETFDAGRLEDGSAYVLMELLRGRSLYQAMQADGPLDPKRLARIMVQVTEGMVVAHEAGIVHRDLKPENIFIVVNDDGEERVKILDFGVSKFAVMPEEQAGRLTVEGTLVGTPYYMSPEQAAGREVDGRTDVYAIGVMMYEALAGRLPFEADTVGALLVKIGAGDCVPLGARKPEIDSAFVEVVHRSFARDIEARYESAESLRRALLGFIGGGTLGARARTISDGARPAASSPTKSTPPAIESDPPAAPDGQALSAPTPAPREPARMPGWVWAAAGIAVAALATLPWALSSGDPPPPMATQGDTEEDETPARAGNPPPAIARDAGVDMVLMLSPSEGALTQQQAPLEPRAPTRPPQGTGNGRGTKRLDPNPYR